MEGDSSIAFILFFIGGSVNLQDAWLRAGRPGFDPERRKGLGIFLYYSPGHESLFPKGET